ELFLALTVLDVGHEEAVGGLLLLVAAVRKPESEVDDPDIGGHGHGEFIAAPSPAPHDRTGPPVGGPAHVGISPTGTRCSNPRWSFRRSGWRCHRRCRRRSWPRTG